MIVVSRIKCNTSKYVNLPIGPTSILITRQDFTSLNCLVFHDNTHVQKDFITFWEIFEPIANSFKIIFGAYDVETHANVHTQRSMYSITADNIGLSAKYLVRLTMRSIYVYKSNKIGRAHV